MAPPLFGDSSQSGLRNPLASRGSNLSESSGQASIHFQKERRSDSVVAVHTQLSSCRPHLLSCDSVDTFPHRNPSSASSSPTSTSSSPPLPSFFSRLNTGHQRVRSQLLEHKDQPVLQSPFSIILNDIRLNSSSFICASLIASRPFSLVDRPKDLPQS